MFNIHELTNHTSLILLLALFSFFLSMLITPVFTHFGYKYKWWKRRSTTHATTGEALTVISSQRIKRTIPRMAGLIILVAVIVTTVMFNLSRNQTWLPLAALAGGGVVGLLDDIINIRGSVAKLGGLRPLAKLATISLVALVLGWFFYDKLGFSVIHFPGLDVHFGWVIIPIFIIAVISTGNAVNITDGVDGLAGGLLISAYTAFAIIAALQGNFGIAAFCMTIVGALLAYTWFNIPPARFVMGDVGSFALGTALGVVAMLINCLFLLPIVGLVFVAEAGSVLLQILSKKFLHRKIFIASPIHHHFEALDWPKTKVTMRFWILGQAFAALGVIIALIGGFV